MGQEDFWASEEESGIVHHAEDFKRVNPQQPHFPAVSLKSLYSSVRDSWLPYVEQAAVG